MKALLGMSGGVDSTYAVHSLRLMGYEVEGAVIKMHKFSPTDDAVMAAESLGVPLHVIDGSELFEKKVVSYFINEYRKARTPNPCIICNEEVKFKLLLEYARKNGFDKIATGHYADTVTVEDGEKTRLALRRSQDSKKDQTYMLWRLSQDVLSSVIFPLSEKLKSDVKREAAEMMLSAANRSESQEICFIPDGDYASFIEERIGKCPEGDFVDENGRVLGKHKGIIRYTVGQRKGLGIALGERAFITDINAENNVITVSTHDSFSSEFTVSNTVFSGLSKPCQDSEFELEVKHRYLAPPMPARVKVFKNGDARVYLKEPVRAVTPGQSAVFYKGDTVMFGGIIDSRI